MLVTEPRPTGWINVTVQRHRSSSVRAVAIHVFRMMIGGLSQFPMSTHLLQKGQDSKVGKQFAGPVIKNHSYVAGLSVTTLTHQPGAVAYIEMNDR